MTNRNEQDSCNFCGGTEFETRRIEYLYSHAGEYMIVPNTPVQICSNCGMLYYEAAVLKEIERRFFAIQKHIEEPDTILQVPTAVLA
ncbi:MAG: type II toxin-antitoxin system MqsA family antitoxin [Caldilineaceae bacterium]|nr:type II toxin-antitoxin system MqsA family antitoxin [Caldilineaceae bacterium]